MQFLTDFADTALTLPLALSVAVWLFLAGWRRGAGAWLAGLGCLLATVVALKLVFLSCGPPPHRLLSPSGHVAWAAFLYGGVVSCLLRLRPPAALLAGIIAAAIIGFSRIALHAHTVTETLAGCAAGLLALLIFLRGAGPMPAHLAPSRFALAGLPLVLALHGLHLDLEPDLRGAAGGLARMFCSIES